MKPRTLLHSLGGIGVGTLAIAFTSSTSSPLSDTPTFQEVHAADQVEATFVSTDGHTGNCIVATFVNKTPTPIQFTLEPGRRLISDDPTEQDILVTREVPIILAANQSAEVPVYGFCTQAKNGCPDRNDGFAMGYITTDTTYELAQFLSVNDFPEEAEQDAIWCLSDGYATSRINYHDRDSIMPLIEWVAERRGEPVPRYNMDYRENEEGMPTNHALAFTAGVKYETFENAMLHIVLYDKYGIGVKRQWIEVPVNDGTERNYFNMEVADLPEGHYYLKVYNTSVAEVDEFAVDV